jgi:hypothetical protein
MTQREMTQGENITGKLDSDPASEAKVAEEIEKALRFLRAEAYEVTYADDGAGDLAIKLENGDAQQTITLEAHAWPGDIFDRIVSELKI